MRRDPAFEAIVARLRAEDPEFAHRVHKFGAPPSKARVGLAVLLWTLAPVFIILGGWTGLLLAVIAVAYGAWLRWAGSLYQSAGSQAARTRGRHPGASL